jgi:hypothetical protein
MSHFFVVATNENGIITDEYLGDDLKSALAAPFDFSDVFVYSHGWWNTPNRATQDYNRFTIEFAQTVRSLASATTSKVPRASLGIGIYWPSMLSADQNAFFNNFQAASFYTMEKRADAVGEHAGYLLLKLIAGAESSKISRLHLIGHSFGCKVLTNALQWLTVDKRDTPAVDRLNTLALNLVLIEAALDEDHLEKGDAYGDIATKYPNIRLLATTSREDSALQEWYPRAQLAKLVTIGDERRALGAVGPTDKAAKQFGGRTDLVIDSLFKPSTIAKSKDRLLVADITPLHRDRELLEKVGAKADKFSGHHSTIFLPPLYNLMSAFLLGAADDTKPTKPDHV